jgi:hypothetical protein
MGPHNDRTDLPLLSAPTGIESKGGPRGIASRVATVALICTAQAVTVIVGAACGLSLVPMNPLAFPALCGGFAVLLLIAEWLHFLLFSHLRRARPLTPWICLALGSYASLLMYQEAFL